MKKPDEKTAEKNVGVSLERRIEIGATLRLNVGPPNESLTDSNGKSTMPVRDNLGLLLDPKVYAKRRCTCCGGRGVYTVHRSNQPKGVKTETFTHSVHTKMETCYCVSHRYERARVKLLAAVNEELRKTR